jgi:5-oxoprolinase (ATP-hydrolysing) subunit A
VWDEERAAAVVEVAARFGLPVLALPGSVLLARAAAAGLGVRREFFADRAYDDAGRLVPRSEPGAVIDDPAAVERRVRTLVVDGVVTTVGGSRLAVQADSICVHGDTAEAPTLARVVRAVLAELS